MEILRQLRRFARTSFSDNNKNLVLPDGVDYILLVMIYRQVLAGLFNGFGCGDGLSIWREAYQGE